MNISFQNKKLEKLLDNPSKLTRELGALRTKLFLKRLSACDLDHPYRLIFEPHEDPIPTDSSGRYIWLEIKGVEVIEITNYHGK